MDEKGRFDLSGKVAFLTGGAGGFGSAIALGLADHGADVIITDIDGDAAASLGEQVSERGRRALSYELDIGQPLQVERVVQQSAEGMGGIDILINVACAAKLDPLLTMSYEAFQETLSSCLIGAFAVSRAVGRVMVANKSRGSIIHISSIAGSRALGRGTGAYAASKAGLNALIRELAVEWGEHGIRVNGIAPCQFRTKTLMKVLSDPRHGGPEELEKKMVSRIPLGRLGEPEDIVGPCIFLASEASAMVDGHVLYVDGGYTAV